MSVSNGGHQYRRRLGAANVRTNGHGASATKYVGNADGIHRSNAASAAFGAARPGGSQRGNAITASSRNGANGLPNAALHFLATPKRTYGEFGAAYSGGCLQRGKRPDCWPNGPNWRT